MDTGRTLTTDFSTASETTAIIVPGENPLTISYRQLAEDIKELQTKFAQLGITRTNAVSIAIPNSYEFIVSFLATASQGAIAAPLNPAYKQEEFEFYVDDLKSSLCLVPRGQYANNSPAVRAARAYNAAIAECYLDGSRIILDLKEQGKLKQCSSSPVLQAEPEDIALVLHTSGTTGRPKAVPLTHRNLTRTMRNVQETYELIPSDRTLLVMPLFHVHGLLAGLLGPLRSGGSVIVPPRFSATQFWKDFINHNANWWTAVPTMHQILLKNSAPSPMPEVRFIRSCSAPLSPKVFHELEKTYNAPVLEAYAMTEASHQMTSNPLPYRGKRQPGSVGLGQGVDVRILDDAGQEVPQGTEGEVCIRGENVTKGYLNNPKANAEAFFSSGFFRTGDQGKKDADGYVILTGRIKELINRGGEKISPIELDNLLATHPKVAEAVSFAVPSELYGQEVGVAVVEKAGQTANEKEILEFVANRTAAFKKPSRIWILKEIPKTATGKIQRRKVAETLLARDTKAKL